MDTRIAGMIRLGAFVAGFGVLCTSASANMLVNSGFEDPVTMDGPPFVGSWEAFNAGEGTYAVNSTAMPLTGAQSLELGIDDVANAFAGAFQDVLGVSAGESWTFSGWHKLLGDAGGIEIRIEWRNSMSNSEIARTTNFTQTPGSEYEQFQIVGSVPIGADTARVVYAIQSFGGAINQTAFVDDVSFVPAPSCAALLGVGALGMARRRRMA